MSINRETFYSLYIHHFGIIQHQSVVDGLNFILDSMYGEYKFDYQSHESSFLAQIKHETGGLFQPITERGSKEYFNKYEPDTQIGKNLGNRHIGDGYLYRGRGFLQVTGRENYRKFSDLIMVDLISNPDKALDPTISYKISYYGVRAGLFTGVSFYRYMNSARTDFKNARRVVNGLDKADKIAKDSETFNHILSRAKADNTYG